MSLRDSFKGLFARSPQPRVTPILSVTPGISASIQAKQPAERLVGRYLEHHNTVRLHSATGYITPLDKLEGRGEQIWAERDRKLEEARKQREERRRQHGETRLGFGLLTSPPSPPALLPRWQDQG